MNHTEGLKVVSLFDGISCGRVALERAGYTVFSYHAFEIDKYAKAISCYQYPDIQHYGDVLNANFSAFINSGIDLVIGGSPCTFWSIAKNNREIDKNGMGWKLFMRFVEAVRQIRPRYFLLENVASMPSSIKAYISEELGCEPVMINSALLSAQSRKRLYWTNITGVTQPEDKGILLKDILEKGLAAREKSYCIDASYYKGGSSKRLDNQSGRRQMVYEPITLSDKSHTILSTLHKENTPLAFASQMRPGGHVSLSMVKRQKTGLFVAHEFDGCGEMGAALRTREDGNGRLKRLEVRNDGKPNALTTVLTDSIVCSPVRIGSFGKGGQGDRIYSVQGKTISLMANGGGRGAKTGLYRIDLPDGNYTIRKLTPIEAERCQTLDDGFTEWGIDNSGKTVRISNTQRYRAIGNGFTVDVIAHILSHM